MKFANAINNREARTENGMKAHASTADAVVDLFFKIGASRGKNIIPDFVAAYTQDQDLAVRVALWARDAREGAGERQLFRNILTYLEANDPDAAFAVSALVPELGRWDDLLVFTEPKLYTNALRMFAKALEAGNGLAAKWTPRKGRHFEALRKFMGYTPKRMRKTIVGLTKVVETQMCAKQWTEINFSHVPSLAHSRYKKAFGRNAGEVYVDYLNRLKKGDPTVKVNAGAVYPYDVIKTAMRGDRSQSELIEAQWAALPNYVGDAKILPIVDVSGSMTSPVATGLTAMDVAVSLGLYLADKNTGDFKDCFLTFTDTPRLQQLKGSILKKIDQLRTAEWGFNTNLHAAFEVILNTALNGNVSQEDMPQTVLILSDMQFDQCVTHDDRAIDMIRRKYEQAGYQIPNVVFWNINSYDNVPVKFDESGTALVSGFSPTIVRNVLGQKNITPRDVMLETIMNDRYNWKAVKVA